VIAALEATTWGAAATTGRVATATLSAIIAAMLISAARPSWVEKKRAVYIESLLLVPVSGIELCFAGGVPNRGTPGFRGFWQIGEIAYVVNIA
jgi:hypothetical protein